MSNVRLLLERAVAAEQERDRLRAELEVARAGLLAAVDAGPETAAEALRLPQRVLNAETLVEEALYRVRKGYLPPSALTPGWVPRAEALIAARNLAERMQQERRPHARRGRRGQL